MPNWCSNSVHFEHKNPAMITRLVDALLDERLFQEFIPCPQELYDTSSTGGYSTSEEHKTQMQINMEKYGHTDWYSWCVENWGVKWDVGTDDVEHDRDANSTEVDVYFDSAWCPPIKAYEKLAELGFDISAYFYEEGMSFCGSWDNENEEDFYDIPDTVEEAEQEIPKDILDEFNILEEMEYRNELNEEED